MEDREFITIDQSILHGIMQGFIEYKEEEYENAERQSLKITERSGESEKI